MPSAKPHSGDRRTAQHIHNTTVRKYRNAKLSCLGQQFSRCAAAVLSDRHRHIGFRKIEGRLVSTVIVGDDDGPLFRRNRKTVEIGAESARQHHAGTVIVGEYQGPLKSARRMDHGAEEDDFQPDVPCRGISDIHHGLLAVIEALHCRTCHQPRIAALPDPGHAISAPSFQRVNLHAEQTAARFEILFGDDDPRAGLRRDNTCRKARRP